MWVQECIRISVYTPVRHITHHRLKARKRSGETAILVGHLCVAQAQNSILPPTVSGAELGVTMDVGRFCREVLSWMMRITMHLVLSVYMQYTFNPCRDSPKELNSVTSITSSSLSYYDLVSDSIVFKSRWHGASSSARI